MSRTGALQLAKIPNVVQRDRILTNGLTSLVDLLHSDQVENAVQQHRRMTTGQYKPIATRPLGVLRVVLHLRIPNLIRNWSKRHRSARVAAIGSLHCVHTERANGVDSGLIDGGGRCGHIGDAPLGFGSVESKTFKGMSLPEIAPDGNERKTIRLRAVGPPAVVIYRADDVGLFPLDASFAPRPAGTTTRYTEVGFRSLAMTA